MRGLRLCPGLFHDQEAEAPHRRLLTLSLNLVWSCSWLPKVPNPGSRPPQPALAAEAPPPLSEPVPPPAPRALAAAFSVPH